MLDSNVSNFTQTDKKPVLNNLCLVSDKNPFALGLSYLSVKS